MDEKELKALNRAIDGIIFNKFGGVCLSVICYDNQINLTVFNKKCSCKDKTKIIEKEFEFKSLNKTITEIEYYIIMF